MDKLDEIPPGVTFVDFATVNIRHSIEAPERVTESCVRPSFSPAAIFTIASVIRLTAYLQGDDAALDGKDGDLTDRVVAARLRQEHRLPGTGAACNAQLDAALGAIGHGVD